MDDPCEHCRRVGTQLLRQELITLFSGDGVDEWDEVHASPYGFAAVFDCGLVVAHQVQVVGGGELEEVLVHEAGGDAVTTGEHLQLCLIEGVGCVGFGTDHETLTVEARQFGGVFLEGLLHQEPSRQGCGVVAECAGDGVVVDALAVAAGAVGEGEDVLTLQTGRGVAGKPLHVPGERRIVVEGGGEEPLPGGGGACGCHGGLFGVHAFGCLWHEFSCSEVDDSGGGVEFVEVGVEG